jgi:hypothetical protein
MIEIKHLGQERELSYWAKYYGIAYGALYARYKKWGDKPDKLFRTYKGINYAVGSSKLRGVVHEPVGTKLFTYQGREMTLYNWSRELGITYKTLEMRARRGKTAGDLFAPSRMYIPMKKYVG